MPHAPEIVGREALMVDSIKALADARLVTLTGSGGIGKTTVAEEVARWHAERELFRDGVFFVSLEGIIDAVRLAETLARALNVTPEPTNPLGSVQAALARREILLLLDNAETLLDDPVKDASSAVGVLGTLLEAASGLKLLVTSREALAPAVAANARPWANAPTLWIRHRRPTVAPLLPGSARLTSGKSRVSQPIVLGVALATSYRAWPRPEESTPFLLTTRTGSVLSRFSTRG